jgi:hypothetical protein
MILLKQNVHQLSGNVEGYNEYLGKVKVKFSQYRPWRPLGLREVDAPTFSDIRLIDGGKVVGPTRRPLFTPQEVSWYPFLLEAESTSGPECGWKD